MLGPVKTWALKFLSGGAGYVIIALIGLGLIKGFADHYYDKGMADCEAAQAKENDVVEDLGAGLAEDLAAINAEKDDKNDKIDDDYKAGLSLADVDKARADGIRLGKQMVRAAAIDDERRSGSCLVDFYASDSGMLKRARSLQQDVFGYGAGRDGGTSADTLSGAPGSGSLPGAAPGNYPKPD